MDFTSAKGLVNVATINTLSMVYNIGDFKRWQERYTKNIKLSWLLKNSLKGTNSCAVNDPILHTITLPGLSGYTYMLTTTMRTATWTGI